MFGNTVYKEINALRYQFCLLTMIADSFNVACFYWNCPGLDIFKHLQLSGGKVECVCLNFIKVYV